MRSAGYVIALMFIGWMVTMIRFNCTNIDRSRCQAMCQAKGKEMRSLERGLIVTCRCATDWLKKQRENEELRRRPISP